MEPVFVAQSTSAGQDALCSIWCAAACAVLRQEAACSAAFGGHRGARGHRGATSAADSHKAQKCAPTAMEGCLFQVLRHVCVGLLVKQGYARPPDALLTTGYEKENIQDAVEQVSLPGVRICCHCMRWMWPHTGAQSAG